MVLEKSLSLICALTCNEIVLPVLVCGLQEASAEGQFECEGLMEGVIGNISRRRRKRWDSSPTTMQVGLLWKERDSEESTWQYICKKSSAKGSAKLYF